MQVCKRISLFFLEAHFQSFSAEKLIYTSMHIIALLVRMHEEDVEEEEEEYAKIGL